MKTDFRFVDEAKTENPLKILTFDDVQAATLLRTMKNSNSTMCRRVGVYIEGDHS